MSVKHMESIKNWLVELPCGKLLLQFIKFGLVGLTNTTLSYGIYALILRLGGHYLAASIVSFIVSVAWSYMLNNRFVFQKANGETRVWWKTLLKAYVSYGVTGLVLANVLLYLWIDVLNVNQYLAFFLNLVFTIPVSFLLNKLWAFKKEAVPATDEGSNEADSQND